jgi:hypothetical protein
MSRKQQFNRKERKQRSAAKPQPSGARTFLSAATSARATGLGISMIISASQLAADRNVRAPASGENPRGWRASLARNPFLCSIPVSAFIFCLFFFAFSSVIILRSTVQRFNGSTPLHVHVTLPVSPQFSETCARVTPVFSILEQFCHCIAICFPYNRLIRMVRKIGTNLHPTNLSNNYGN